MKIANEFTVSVPVDEYSCGSALAPTDTWPLPYATDVEVVPAMMGAATRNHCVVDEAA